MQCERLRLQRDSEECEIFAGYLKRIRGSVAFCFHYRVIAALLLLMKIRVSGYPVLRNKVDFRRANKAANKEDLNKLVTVAKVIIVNPA
jgi:hypothetical protein